VSKIGGYPKIGKIYREDDEINNQHFSSSIVMVHWYLILGQSYFFAASYGHSRWGTPRNGMKWGDGHQSVATGIDIAIVWNASVG
jgi:hypothetical protein